MCEDDFDIHEEVQLGGEEESVIWSTTPSTSGENCCDSSGMAGEIVIESTMKS